MERKIQIALLLATLAVVALIVLNVVISPMDAKREWLRSALSQVPETTTVFLETAQTMYSAQIAERSDVWGALVDKPKEVVVVKKSEKPDLNKLMEGVEVTRFKVGDRIKIISKTSPDGGFYGVGEKVQGCILKEFTRTEAVFTYEWKEGKQNLELRLPRK